jgi:carbamoyltransferase
VLNSSFNDNDEPIVRSPKDAIRTFFGTGLYELYIGYFKVRKS